VTVLPAPLAVLLEGLTFESWAALGRRLTRESLKGQPTERGQKLRDEGERVDVVGSRDIELTAICHRGRLRKPRLQRPHRQHNPDQPMGWGFEWPYQLRLASPGPLAAGAYAGATSSRELEDLEASPADGQSRVLHKIDDLPSGVADSIIDRNFGGVTTQLGQ
jgi:hypothetical protein